MNGLTRVEKQYQVRAVLKLTLSKREGGGSRSIAVQ
jgi:hypothetical protein